MRKNAADRIAIVSFAIASVALTAACSSAPPPAPRPVPSAKPPAPVKTAEAPAGPTREPPPESAPPADFRVPSATWSELPNGMRVGMVESRALPMVEIRVAVLGGSAADGERPGLAALTAELLRSGGAGAMSGRDEIARIESLGADLTARADFDRITLRLTVMKDLVGEALALLGDIVARPQLSPTVFGAIKKRATARAIERAQTDDTWDASMVLFRDLFALPVGSHPYATFDATAEDLSKVTAMDCRGFWARHFVPKNTFVVLAGDVVTDDLKAALTKAFGGFAGGEPPVVSFTDPVPPESLKITVVDRPKAAQSSLYIGEMGPSRADADWPAFTVASQLLGGSGVGFVYADLRGGPVVSSPVASNLIELAGSPVVYYAQAKAPTSQTGVALKGLLDHIGAVSAEARSDQDVDTAKRALVDSMGLRLGRASDLADAIVNLRTLNLWDDAISTYRKALLDVTPIATAKVASEHLRTAHAVVVVTGDAESIGPMLSHFGEVKVVDPTKGFQRVRTIPMDAEAPIKPSRAEPTGS